ncbi:protein-L-isoaspartate(D-aspartate) O-methyltransferase [Gammaproteobacteria bacterium AB-CW1]|uniref:Protein-L-isoaspartate O-methyltransferase n=1 Tax=Natronospira elongata TaxID=3110268 RepID=A0AAP6JFQ3_9GAMM|nr:protein-L-isoaspartate(D-aspartate) O-methyltransferase [Gammaproteobacteria bacterium AB-CW1]
MNAPIEGIGMTSARTRERLVQRLKDNGIQHPGVLDAIRNVPRHLFVDEALSSRSYEDTALPIGHGQTISQPWVVARMTEALIENGRPERVLEIGTGCGYQTAVMSGLVGQIDTVERISALLQRARRNLRQLGVRNVRFHHADGYEGWQDHAPFDGILAAAAPEAVPEALLEQLADGGTLVIPVGPSGCQELLRITRDGEQFTRENLGLVSFVPLRGGRA